MHKKLPLFLCLLFLGVPSVWAAPQIDSTMNASGNMAQVNNETSNSAINQFSNENPINQNPETKLGKLNDFVQPFQNHTTSLTGTSVQSTMYFTKVDYWKIKEATLNLVYEVSQLADTESSDLTLSLNGVKFYSFHPKDGVGKQTISISLPKELIQDSNTLTIQGQIVNQDKKTKQDVIVQTPANWLTIYDGSTVNFSFSIIPPKKTIASFYRHFVGVDTITNKKSVILTPKNATEEEMDTAAYALTGISRLITTNNQVMEWNELSNKKYRRRPYQIIISTYDHLPQTYKKKIKESDCEDAAILKYVRDGKKHILIVTAKTGKDLIKAGRYIANQELMEETKKAMKKVTSETKTFTSELAFNGNYPLTTESKPLVGQNHQEQVYFVSVPRDQTNSEGSYINLNFRYADNLDFKNSLVTVYVNNKPIGSKALTAEKANGDHFRIALPKDMNLANSFVVKVAFDLNLKNKTLISNTQTPWAYIENDSNAYIRTMDRKEVLFNNYPSIFITNRTFNQLAIQLPEKMNSYYYQALSNVLNLLGNYAERNVGDISIYKNSMSTSDMTNHNVILLGGYKDNDWIRKLNKDLYFQFNQEGGFISNEKMSLEDDYGRQIGVDQLMFNPYDKQKVLLAVTGYSAEQVYLASTEINTQKNAAMFKGDAIVATPDGQPLDYRFKKNAVYEEKLTFYQKLKKNPYLKSLLFFMTLGIASILLLLILLVRKYWVKK